MATKKKPRAGATKAKRKTTRRGAPPPSTQRDVALHRAAHAVAAAVLGLPFQAVTIDAEHDALGTLVCGCVFDPDHADRKDRKSMLDANGVMLIAGPVADVLWSGKKADTEQSAGWKGDLEGTKKILDQLGKHAGRALTSAQRGTTFEAWWGRADQMLTATRELVALVANELLERGTVEGQWVLERAREATAQEPDED